MKQGDDKKYRAMNIDEISDDDIFNE